MAYVESGCTSTRYTSNALVMTSVAISARVSTGPGQVAQLAEHAAENRGVGSSILPLAT
jgi:hypothetical protein